MCGIVGILNRTNAKEISKKAIKIISYRGKDAIGFWHSNKHAVTHCLHSIASRKIKQPFIGKGIFAADCEIYNWKGLNQRFQLNARNDAEALFFLLERYPVRKVLTMLDGTYAFCYLKNNQLILARDIIGIKPVWFSHSEGFAFASEKKALEKNNYFDVNELNPREILIYDLVSDRIKFYKRKFFSVKPEIKSSEEAIAKKLRRLIRKAIKKRVPDEKFGLLFSGGIDSTVIAKELLDTGYSFQCYCAYFKHRSLKTPEDLIFAKKAAEELGLKLKIIPLNLSQVENALRHTVSLIEDTDVTKNAVGLTFYAACKKAKADGCKVIFSGLGSEEIFAGYMRHKKAKNADINIECLSGLINIHERDLYRDNVISAYHNLELRLPFLDQELVRFALRIPGKLKLKNGIEKYILRKAYQDILPDFVVWRKKKAAQYGSLFLKAIKKLAKKYNFRYMKDYLKNIYRRENLPLAALISGGKDSLYAAYIMHRLNYNIKCFVTIQSENPDSFMYHTPNTKWVGLQAKAADIPVIFKKTKGKPEEELEDLSSAIEEARRRFNIKGVVLGALYSRYQRSRVERICNNLGLKMFSPLWHVNQETEMKELLKEGFDVIITKVAAEGLDKKWLGKKISNEIIERLLELKERFAINVAGEGGEFETFVLDCPLFKKRIKIKEYEIIEESAYVAELKIKKAVLIEK
ncbi:diphthine--ammonia ligase [Candidatus Woesearchaeota archaeon]|nr:MAG: diphthine--ammonia ligase [Candidatus Woesearchaeota archaeon]